MCTDSYRRFVMVNLSTMQHSSIKPPRCWPLLALFLLFILAQQLCALVVSHGQLVSSTEAIISPFNFCLRGQGVGVTCKDQHNNMAATAGVLVDILRDLVIMSLYTPLVLVPFALMAFLFAVCCDDRGVLWFSVGCQAASSLLMLVGLCVFVGLHFSYVSMAGMTAGYYVCVCVNAELATAAVLTWMTGRWQLRDERTAYDN